MIETTGAEIRLATLYGDRMNIYADRGNILFLRRRCEWRGIQFEETAVDEGSDFDPGAVDLAYIGGGQDSDQVAVAEDLRVNKREAIAGYIASGRPMLAVCGGYQLMGRSYELDNRTLEGLDLVDMHTIRSPGPRLIGNVVIESDLGIAIPAAPRKIAGFENHGGRTILGEEAEPLGRVVSGNGNDGTDGTEGVWLKGLIGTYLHGPLLPKNWWIADYLIAQALRGRYGDEAPKLSPLDDNFERGANRCAFEAARSR